MTAAGNMLMAGAASVWTPASLPGLAAWHDPSDTATVTLVSSAVSNLADKSGNGKDLSQATAGRRPTITTLNGLNALSFSGSNVLGWSSVTAVPLGTDQTVLTVTTSGSNAYVWTASDGSSSSNHEALISGFGQAFEVYAQNIFALRFTLASTATGHHLIGFKRAGTAFTGRYDGTASGSGTASANNAAYANSLGGYVDSGNVLQSPLTGTVGELIITSNAMSAGDLTSAEAYLKAKWGTP